MIFYKIRDKKTGLFSKGGCNPQWSKTGKVWNSQGTLSNHLTMVDTAYGYQLTKNLERVYADAEILICGIQEMGTLSVVNWMDDLKQRREKRFKKKQARLVDDLERALRLQQYERLKKEFG